MDNYHFKVLVGGCTGENRRNILTKFTSGKTSSNTQNIIGVDFAAHCVEFPQDNETATLQIWDFGEEERFRILVPMFCMGASGAIIYINLFDPHSRTHLSEWVNLLREKTPNIPIILCSAICEDQARNACIDDDSIQEMINAYNLQGYFEINIENGSNFDETIEYLTKLMIKYYPSTILNDASKSIPLLPAQLYE